MSSIKIGNIELERTYRVSRLSNTTGKVLKVVCEGDESTCDDFIAGLSDAEMEKHGYSMEETTYYKYP